VWHKKGKVKEMSVVEITDQEFEEKVKKSQGKVLVDCFAEWCGPCKMLSPIIDEIAEEIDTCTFYKLNVDNSTEVVTEYGIMSIPTLLYFENGELKNQSAGFMAKEDLIELIK